MILKGHNSLYQKPQEKLWRYNIKHKAIYNITALPHRPSSKSREIVFTDKSEQLTKYEEIWKLQKSLVSALFDKNSKTETVIMAQHEPVYTLGAGSTLDNIKFDIENPPYPVFRVERGGEVTYHGPGQIVMYPILDLHNYKCDLHLYLRQLEEVIIIALREVSNIKAIRKDGLTGVWVQNSKIAAIGIRATKWVTYHGLALNVSMDLAPFDLIIPCGIINKSVTSVEGVLRQNNQKSNKPEFYINNDLIKEYSMALKNAFEEVFDVIAICKNDN